MILPFIVASQSLNRSIKTKSWYALTLELRIGRRGVGSLRMLIHLGHIPT